MSLSHDVALLHEVNASHEVLGNGSLVVGLLVHEDIVLTVFVEELIGTTLQTNVIKFETYLESAVEHATVGHVLQLCVHNGVTLTRLAMLELDANPNASVHADGSTLLNVLIKFRIFLWYFEKYE